MSVNQTIYQFINEPRKTNPPTSIYPKQLRFLSWLKWIKLPVSLVDGKMLCSWLVEDEAVTTEAIIPRWIMIWFCLLVMLVRLAIVGYVGKVGLLLLMMVVFMPVLLAVVVRIRLFAVVCGVVDGKSWCWLQKKQLVTWEIQPQGVHIKILNPTCLVGIVVAVDSCRRHCLESW